MNPSRVFYSTQMVMRKVVLEPDMVIMTNFGAMPTNLLLSMGMSVYWYPADHEVPFLRESDSHILWN